MPSQNSQTANPKKALQPFLHSTPPDALGAIAHRSVAICDTMFNMVYPGDADRLLNHPSTQAAFEADSYIPYWAELWPAAQMLGQALLEEASWPNWPMLSDRSGHTALEIGCGIGLPGIVALSLGLHVIFSYYDATAVTFAARNATANGFDNFETLPLDWRVPPTWQVPLILAADVIYEERNVEGLIAFIERVLSPKGICLLSDPDRSTRGGFRYALKRSKLTFTKRSVEADGPAGRRVKGTVYRIQQAQS